MRFVVFLLAAVCLSVMALSEASPASNKKQSQASACSRDCGDKYEPICAKAKTSSKERLITFGSECVMQNYNCQHPDDQFEVKSNQECGGNVSVRLS